MGKGIEKTLKTRILETSIKMFNQYGYNTVTVRDVAKELNISPGNITYYYKKKKDLIDAIFELQYTDYKNMNLSADVDVEGLNTIFYRTINHQQKYFFYFNNIIEIPRCYPDLAHRQKEVTSEFYDFFKNILENFKEKGMMKKPLNEGAYGDIAFGLISIILFWIEQNSFNENFTHDKIVQVLWNNILPCFTDKGIEMYKCLNIQKQ